MYPLRNGGTPYGYLLAGVKTTDTDRSSTTPSDDPHMTVELEASAYYEWTCFFIRRSDATTSTLKYGFAWPSGATGSYGFTNDALTAYDEAFGAAHTGSLTTTEQALKVIGTIATSSAGTFAFQWSENTGTGDSARIVKGSYITVRRIG